MWLLCIAEHQLLHTGEGPLAFCSGGDQDVRGKGGYVGEDGIPRLNVLDLQMQIRRLPKPVVAMVAGYAVGGGHILHMVCDLTIAADNAVFGQTGPKVGSFDAGYGSTHMVRCGLCDTHPACLGGAAFRADTHERPSVHIHTVFKLHILLLCLSSCTPATARAPPSSSHTSTRACMLCIEDAWLSKRGVRPLAPN